MNLKILGALSILVAAPMAKAEKPHDGQVVDLEAKYLFVPRGFDDQDEAVAVVDGFLPSGCYKLVAPEVKRDDDARTVSITPKAQFFNSVCIEALVPYNFEVKIGRLPPGEFQVKVTTSGLTNKLAVGESPSITSENPVYAPVDRVTLDKANGRYTATLELKPLPGWCLDPEEVRVTNSGSTVEVLPIIKPNEQPNCAVSQGEPLTWRVNLPDLTPGKKLLHVRTFGGKTVNVVFAVSPY